MLAIRLDNRKCSTDFVTNVDKAAEAMIIETIRKSYPQHTIITEESYPESHPEGGLCTFRADIEVSTCGVISPLNALNYLIHQLESDIVTIDYRVRGFTRDVNGMKHFIDHEINSIQNFMSEDMKSLYDMMDVNVYQENIFHTKMLLKEFDLKHYMFHTKPEDLSEEERKAITDLLWKEMREIYYGRNIPAV